MKHLPRIGCKLETSNKRQRTTAGSFYHIPLAKFPGFYNPQEKPCNSFLPLDLYPHFSLVPTRTFSDYVKCQPSINSLVWFQLCFFSDYSDVSDILYVILTKWVLSKIQTISTWDFITSKTISLLKRKKKKTFAPVSIRIFSCIN